jgi:hypothetical protein
MYHHDAEETVLHKVFLFFFKFVFIFFSLLRHHLILAFALNKIEIISCPVLSSFYTLN